MKTKRPEPALGVRKTYKLFVGGEFIRSESGRVAALPVSRTRGEPVNFSHASRKDFRDAVVAARSAQPGWAKKTAYLRGQILYRAAEMLEGRRSEFRSLLQEAGASPAAAKREVGDSIDRLVYYAGWCDKFVQVFGSVNPVASSHFNFTVAEPVGVVALITPPRPLLLPAVTLLAATLAGGNAVILLASDQDPIPALVLAEVLATSDLPGGAANLLAGPRAEILKTLGTHLDVDAVVDASGAEAQGAALAQAGSINLKRCHQRLLAPEEWASPQAANPDWILQTVEFKTAWHPIGF